MNEKILNDQQCKTLADAIAYYLEHHIWDDTGKHDDEYECLRYVVRDLDLRSFLPDGIQPRF